jgi:hypothetical protein
VVKSVEVRVVKRVEVTVLKRVKRVVQVENIRWKKKNKTLVDVWLMRDKKTKK